METFLTVVYVVVCFFLVMVVLLQSGKSGGIGALGGSSQTVFGGAGSGNFMTRLTSLAAALFMVLSATLAYMSTSSEKAIDQAELMINAKKQAVGVGTGDKGAKAQEAGPLSGEEAGLDDEAGEAEADSAEEGALEGGVDAAADPQGVGDDAGENAAPTGAAPESQKGAAPAAQE